MKDGLEDQGTGFQDLKRMTDEGVASSARPETQTSTAVPDPDFRAKRASRFPDVVEKREDATTGRYRLFAALPYFQGHTVLHARKLRQRSFISGAETRYCSRATLAVSGTVADSAPRGRRRRVCVFVLAFVSSTAMDNLKFDDATQVRNSHRTCFCC